MARHGPDLRGVPRGLPEPHHGLDRHTLDGITRGSIYALVALGYTMVYGVMKLINFAHSEVFMVGTWTVLGVYTVLGATAGSGVGLVVGATLLALLAAMLASAGTALAVERIAYRPLRKKGAPASSSSSPASAAPWSSWRSSARCCACSSAARSAA